MSCLFLRHFRCYYAGVGWPLFAALMFFRMRRNIQLGNLNFQSQACKLRNGFFEFGSSRLIEIKTRPVSPRDSKKITRLTFGCGTSEKPEPMLYMFWDDSVGVEGKPDALKKYDYQYDNYGNLITEHYWEEKEGQMVLMQSKNHFYDSQLNSMNQIHLLSYNHHYSAPFVFSKNNLIKTETTIGSQYSFTESYKLKYDENGMVTEDGRWYRNIKQDCK